MLDFWGESGERMPANIAKWLVSQKGASGVNWPWTEKMKSSILKGWIYLKHIKTKKSYKLYSHAINTTMPQIYFQYFSFISQDYIKRVAMLFHDLKSQKWWELVQKPQLYLSE